MTAEEEFEKYMRDQYQWEEQLDMEVQYSQLDMQAAYLAGREAQRKEDSES